MRRHDPEDIDRAINRSQEAKPPAPLIACKTQIALGHAAQDTAKGHGRPDECRQLKGRQGR